MTIFRDPGRYAGWPANYGIWSWANEIVLGFAVGYPRTAVLPDGTVVTAYYFNDEPDGGGPRFIEATVWRP